MKCPKCSYLGFETGDRCKNCGYDFSLHVPSSPFEAADADLTGALPIAIDQPDDSLARISPMVDVPLMTPSADAASEPGQVAFDPPLRPVPPAHSPEGQPVRSLPLFVRSTESDMDDVPLIQLPATPRPPLAVRKTPEIPRLRAVPRPARRSEPALDFLREIEEPPKAELTPPPPSRPAAVGPLEHTGPAAFGARAAAMAVDHALLFAIDAVVLYFTFKIAGLTLDHWRALSPAPLLTFVMFVKLAYFSAFTAVGGQTIGKMAAKIRVVSDTDQSLEIARAVQRTMAAAVSSLLFGLGFVPALLGGDRRALHDRLAHTRVVGLRSV